MPACPGKKSLSDRCLSEADRLEIRVELLRKQFTRACHKAAVTRDALDNERAEILRHQLHIAAAKAAECRIELNEIRRSSSQNGQT